MRGLKKTKILFIARMQRDACITIGLSSDKQAFSKVRP